MKLNLGAGDKLLEGFVNLDKRCGWTFEGGFPLGWRNAEAITISHALMYVPESRWRFAFGEFRRVLAPGGVIRITEDDTANPESERYGGNPGDPELRSLTSLDIVRRYLRLAGFRRIYYIGDQTWLTLFKDKSLIQRWHGDPPKVFHIEGQK